MFCRLSELLRFFPWRDHFNAIGFLLGSVCVAIPAIASKPKQVDSATRLADRSVASGLSGFLPNCPSADCLFSGIELPRSRSLRLAACLSGPDVAADPSCLCADFDYDNAISLRDFALLQETESTLTDTIILVQQPALGYCPEVGVISRVDIMILESGDVIVNGTISAEGDPVVDHCIETWGADCFIEIAFPPRLLTELEIQQFILLMDAIPAPLVLPPHGCCGAFDPCRVRTICDESGRTRSEFCYLCGFAPNPDQALEAYQNLFDFVTDLVTQ